MRALGAAYTTAMALATARPLWRVRASAHGGAFADPFDLTPWVESVEVSRPLREGNAASISLRDPAGQFDPISGTYADAVRAANGTITIEMGEVLAGVPTYWPVMTGQVFSNQPRYDSAEGSVELEILDRALNPWQYSVTPPLYDATAGTPIYWTAHEIIIDVFERFCGFSNPADFNLDPAGDWTLLGAIQFSQESVGQIALDCLQPNGYRVWFDYDGRLTSGLVIPAGLPGAWAVAGTILAAEIASIDGPNDAEPAATRVRVTGGPAVADMVDIGEMEVLGTTHIRMDNSVPTYYDANGDVYSSDMIGPQWYSVWFQGPEETTYRSFCSGIGPIRYLSGDDTAATWTTAPHIVYTDPASDDYHAGMKRHVVNVNWHMNPADGPVDCEVDVMGHRYDIIRPTIYSQEWNDTLIAAWGEKSRSIENPLIYDWTVGALVAGQEMTIASLSARPASVILGRIDLRWEAGDVVNITNPRGATFKLWIVRMSHSAQVSGATTRLEGYVIT